MTPISREIVRSERTLQSLREVAARGCISAWGNRAAFLQFGVVTTILFGFVRPRFKVIGIRQLPALAPVTSSHQSPHWTRPQISDQMELPARSSGDGNAVDAEGIRQAHDLHGGGDCAETEGEGH